MDPFHRKILGNRPPQVFGVRLSHRTQCPIQFSSPVSVTELLKSSSSYPAFTSTRQPSRSLSTHGSTPSSFLHLPSPVYIPLLAPARLDVFYFQTSRISSRRPAPSGVASEDHLESISTRRAPTRLRLRSHNHFHPVYSIHPAFRTPFASTGFRSQRVSRHAILGHSGIP